MKCSGENDKTNLVGVTVIVATEVTAPDATEFMTPTASVCLTVLGDADEDITFVLTGVELPEADKQLYK